MSSPDVVRRGEYAARGDYHRIPDPSWDYYPTYLAKLAAVRAYLDALPRGSRVLDAGCGEGVLVEEYADRLAIVGVDANYSSPRVEHGVLTALPFADASYDRALCLDVLEHLSYEEQPRALAELYRVLISGGELLVSVPNLAHLQSRIQFLFRGRLIRTASESKHPGDRPIGEYLQLARRSGFHLIGRRGIFPTVPVLTHFVRRHPQALAPLHRALTTLLPIPGWCLLNVLVFRKGHAEHTP
ncbi:MAG TPA: class I SAM-dependent methyltransferase [Vicinamibacterales bacterium]|jgi:SAM-dependent methyltransferase|nr:class I SAM-dependent methyltransferase [Vicinamibacterales bacterium]